MTPDPAGQPTRDLGEVTYATGVSLPCRLGPYLLLEEVGRGGMGTVFRARHTALGRIVALKVFPTGPATQPEQVQRFQREGRLAAGLHHPGIVAVHDLGFDEGSHYLAMDFLPGRTLESWIAELPPADASAVVVEKVARAVHYAHGQGVVHRDLKPANVMLDDALEPVVTDFGLAKAFLGDAVDGSLTRTGTVFGTPQYMSPEQAAGCNRLVGPPADVYALGAILYHAMTGVAPYRGDSPGDVLLQILREPPPHPRELAPAVPAALEQIILRAMARDPDRRYPDAAALADDLRRFIDREPIAAFAPSGRLPWVLGAGAAAILLAVGAAVWRPGFRADPPPARPPAAALPAGPILAEAASGLAGLSLDELRDRSARVEEALAAATGDAKPRALERDAERVREELVRRLARDRDQAVREAQEKVAAGDLRGALARLDLFGMEQPRMARHASVLELRSAAEAAAAQWANELAASMEASAAEAPERRADFAAQLALLPEAQAQPIAAHLAVLVQAEEARRTEVGAEAVRLEQTAAEQAQATAADEHGRWTAVLVALEETLAARDVSVAVRLLRDARAQPWPCRGPALRELQEAFERAQGFERAAVRALQDATGRMVELTFLEPQRGGGSATLAVSLQGVETAADGQPEVLYTTRAGRASRRRLRDLDPECLGTLLGPGPIAGALPLYRFVREADVTAGRSLLADPHLPQGVREWVLERLRALARAVIARLEGEVDRGEAEACRWTLEELAAIGDESLDPESAALIARARSLAAKER